MKEDKKMTDAKRYLLVVVGITGRHSYRLFWGASGRWTESVDRAKRFTFVHNANSAFSKAHKEAMKNFESFRIFSSSERVLEELTLYNLALLESDLKKTTTERRGDSK